MHHPLYSGLLVRVKALIMDVVVIMAFMIIATYIFSLFENVTDTTRTIAFVFIFYLYDPLFTSLAGGTLGHRFNGIRVKSAPPHGKNIIFPVALARFIVKSTLGWLSLLTITGNDKKKAIHDYLAGSVVVYKEPKSNLNPGFQTA